MLNPSTPEEWRRMNLLEFASVRCNPRASYALMKRTHDVFGFGWYVNADILLENLTVTWVKAEENIRTRVEFTPYNPRIILRFRGRNAYYETIKSEETTKLLRNVAKCDILEKAHFRSFVDDEEMAKQQMDGLFKLTNGRSLHLETRSTTLQGYFSPAVLNKYFPLICSSSLYLKCLPSSDGKRYHYRELVYANKEKACLHFGTEVSQRFFTKEDFAVLRKTVVANPTIESLSFTCLFEDFNFKALFELLKDPTFMIKNKTINLIFTFFTFENNRLGSTLKRLKEILADILQERNEKVDCIRVMLYHKSPRDYYAPVYYT